MQKSFEIEQGVPEIWGFKRLEMILLCETKRGKIPLWPLGLAVCIIKDAPGSKKSGIGRARVGKKTSGTTRVPEFSGTRGITICY